MKTSPILGALLLVSICINIYLWWNKSDDVINACSSTPGYEPPTIISPDEARDFLNQYRMALRSDSDSIMGGIITRSSLDEILCTKDCNAIVYSFGRDSLGRTGPGGNGVFTILSGVKVDYNSETRKVSRITDLGIKKYIPRNWCPPSCTP